MENTTGKSQSGDICVVCELHCGKPTNASCKLVREATRLSAGKRNVIAVVLGSEILERDVEIIRGCGADEIDVLCGEMLSIYSAGIFSKVLCEFLDEKKPEIVLFPASYQGKDLAPRCAARLDTGLVADSFRLDLNQEEYLAFLRKITNTAIEEDALEWAKNKLKMTGPGAGNNLMATIVCPRSQPCLCTVRTASLPEPEESIRNDCRITIRQPELDGIRSEIQIIRQAAEDLACGRLEDADIVIGLGRGIGDDPKRGIFLAEYLVNALGRGIIGGSRAAVDNGWVSPENLIGQSGKSIKPSVYIALGISGTSQHIAGITAAKTIIAINRTEKAPIHSVADFAIKGDLFKIVPLLIEEINRRKESSA